MKKSYIRPLTLTLQVDVESLLLADSAAGGSNSLTNGVSGPGLNSNDGQPSTLAGNGTQGSLNGNSINDAW